MNSKEIAEFKKILDEIKENLSIPLAELNAENIDWKKMKTGNIGCYSHLRKTLYINQEHRDDPIEFVISTVAHELHHMWQHQKWGWKYFILCMPPIRFYFLEPKAIQVENEVDKILGIQGIRSKDKGTGII